MFANLKNKLIEEVKASKLQQFANAAQAAVSSSSSATPSNSDSASTTTNENFFSITEEDTPQNSPFKPLKLPIATRPPVQRSSTPQSLNGTGAIPRSRRLSNSSMASDISFRLPSYDSSAIYHMQSDFEMSGSEMDDSASTSKLDTITKEQLYDAYRKSLDRYNKYRSRYTDLAKKYKDLERDSTKARSVLVETQEKAIRRISELREQCTLEQQAKAHLEEALRIEMDDMNCKMQAYQTKLKLLGENPDNILAALNETEKRANHEQQLIDLDTTQESGNGNFINSLSAESSDMSAKIALLEKQLEEREKQLQQVLDKLNESNKTIDKLRLQEEENSLLLAQTKQAIHSELENKEKEVKKLNSNIKQLQNDLTVLQKKESESNLLSEELKELKKKIKILEAAKQESDAKLIASEHMYSTMKEQCAAKEKKLTETEEKLSSTLKVQQSELDDVRKQNQQLNEMLQRYQQNESSLADADIELQNAKKEIEILRDTLTEKEAKLDKLQQELSLQLQTNEQIKKDQLNTDSQLTTEKTKTEELLGQINDSKQQVKNNEERIKQLEAELSIINDQNASNESETISKLKDELHKANEESREQLNALKEQVANKEKELKTTTNKCNKLKKQNETQQIKITTHIEDLERLRSEHEAEKAEYVLQQNESKAREEQKEQEKNQLQNQISNILQEISQMEEQMRNVRESHNDLEEEKRQLEIKIEQMEQQSEEGTQCILKDLDMSKELLKQYEQKAQKFESENSQLLEKNCELEERTQRFEKQLLEYERMRDGEEAKYSELRLKLETAEDTIQKLNEKMSQVLDENSRMQNSQELMEHDYRTQQDRCDALEKEKLLALDAQKCAENEKQQLLETHRNEIETQNELIERLQSREQLLTEQSSKLENSNKELSNKLDNLKKECIDLTNRLEEMKALQANDSEVKLLLQSKQEEYAALQESMESFAAQSKNRIKELEENISRFEEQTQAYERTKEEVLMLRDENESLQNELKNSRDELLRMTESSKEIQNELEDLRSLKSDVEQKSKEIDLLRSERMELYDKLKNTEEKLLAKTDEISDLETLNEQCKNNEDIIEQLDTEIRILKELEGKLKTELTTSKSDYQKQLQELQEKYKTSVEELSKLHKDNSDLEDKMKNLQSNFDTQLAETNSLITNLQTEKEDLLQKLETIATQRINLEAIDEMKIENEYLNKLVKQLESDLEKQKHESVTNSLDSEELKVKFKSVQCELYVLKENAETHEKELKEKELEIQKIQESLDAITKTLAAERKELQRQTEHSNFVTEQNDQIQKELMHTQQQLAELEHKFNDTNAVLNELRSTSSTQSEEYQNKIKNLEEELEKYRNIKENLEETIKNISTVDNEKDVHSSNDVSRSSVIPLNSETTSNAEHLRQLNETLQSELEELARNSRVEIETLEHENDELKCSNKQLLEHLAQLEKICAGFEQTKLCNNQENGDLSSEKSWNEEKNELEIKLKTIMSEVQDVSNRNLFLEQKCENFLILEQSNERLKLQNAKLSRQLDETLVSMQHNEGVSANTEFEYLRNIMFQYLTGTASGNNETLVKVISAVLKFSPQQTQVALEKEHQRRSLINKIL